MKKIFLISILAAVLIGIPSFLVYAQGKIPNCCVISNTVTVEGTTYTKGQTVGYEADDPLCNVTDPPSTRNHTTKQWGLICLLASIKSITDWIFNFLIVFVGIMVIFGAFTLVTSAGDPQKVKNGRNYILYACIGMIAGFLSKALPAFLGLLFFGE